jgi:hypothetical protein
MFNGQKMGLCPWNHQPALPKGQSHFCQQGVVVGAEVARAKIGTVPNLSNFAAFSGCGGRAVKT